LNTKNILLTGGRAPATLHLARLFFKAGHKIFVAESLEFPLTKNSKAVYKSFSVSKPRQKTTEYINDLKKIIVENHIDILIPTCEEIFYISQYKNELSKHCTVFVEDIEKLLSLHNKHTFIEKLETYQINAPGTAIAVNYEQLREIVKKINKRIILKPVYSRFSSKIIILEEGNKETPRVHISESYPWIVQEFIEGQQYCTYSIVHNGKLVAHSTYATEFTAGKGATIAFQHNDNSQILEWVKKFVHWKNLMDKSLLILL
jgi:glutathione synthase/RimK-type ligase-like ATP-grasp enzyme